MSVLPAVPQSLRRSRARALAPRLLVYLTLLILCIAGLSAIIAGPPAPVAAPKTAASAPSDSAAEAFAEGFAAIYLSWDAEDPESREKALLTYLPTSLAEDAGLSPARGTSQEVVWTAAMASHRSKSLLNVTVAARTSAGQTLHLVVPVARDERGFLSVAGYPALVGAPPLDDAATPPLGDEVEEAELELVVERALTNYLGGARENLIADLAADAVVSLPALQLTVTSVETPTWVIPNRRVAALVAARDGENNTWTLRYELDVRRGDRWYVRGIEIDPTLKGGT